MSRGVLIVDGYNVIRDAGGPYIELYSTDPDSARTQLLADVAGYAHGEWRATVVFDAGSNPASEGHVHDVAGVGVIFSAYGTDADTVIERIASEARAAGESVVVVSSDAQTQWSVMGPGVSRMSSRLFVAEMMGERSERSESALPALQRTTVSERIDSRVRDQLIRWSRGQR